MPLGSAAHVLAGRDAPELGTTLVLLALVLGFAAVALRRPPSVARVVTVVVAAQVVVHVVLSTVAIASDGSFAPASPVTVVHHGHEHTMHASDGSWAMLGSHLVSGLTSASGLAMTAAHALAAALVGLLIARGDQSLRTLLNLRHGVRAALLVLADVLLGARALASGVAVGAALVVRVRPDDDGARLRPAPWIATARRRGPPALLAA